MKKVLEYREKKLEIVVSINGSSDPYQRGADPNHLIVVNGIGDFKYQNQYSISPTEDLERRVVAIEEETKKKVDGLLDGIISDEQITLENIGYEKQ